MSRPTPDIEKIREALDEADGLLYGMFALATATGTRRDTLGQLAYKAGVPDDVLLDLSRTGLCDATDIPDPYLAQIQDAYGLSIDDLDSLIDLQDESDLSYEGRRDFVLSLFEDVLL